MIDPAPLIEWRSRYTLLTDDAVKGFRIDNSKRTPEQVADEIVDFVMTA